MIEIFAIIYFSRKIGQLAAEKGLSANAWKWKMILAWVAAEIVGIIIGFVLFGSRSLFPAMLVGIGCAISAYYWLHSILSDKPDVVDDYYEFGTPE